MQLQSIRPAGRCDTRMHGIGFRIAKKSFALFDLLIDSLDADQKAKDRLSSFGRSHMKYKNGLGGKKKHFDTLRMHTSRLPSAQ